MSDVAATVEPEVLVPLAKQKAEQLDKRIRTMAGSVGKQWATLEELVRQAKAGLVHEVLGYKSWPSYVADAVGGQLQLSGETRQTIVQMLHGEGMSERAIAQATGLSKTTVHRELSGGPSGPPDVTDLRAALKDQHESFAERVRPTPVAVTAKEEDKRGYKTPVLPTTGLDGKKYPKPKPKPPRRKPLPDAFVSAVLDLARVTKRITALTEDDRVAGNRDQLKRYRWDMVLGCLRIREAVEKIDGTEPSIKAAFELLCENTTRNDAD